MHKFKLLPLLLMMLPFSAFASAPKAPVAPVEKQPVVCTPNYVKNNPDQKACIPPDRNTVGLFVYQPHLVMEKGSSWLKSNYPDPGTGNAWYVYLGGLCTLSYDSIYTVSCITPGGTKTGVKNFIAGVRDIIAFYKQSSNWFEKSSKVGKIKVFIGVEVGGGAIEQITLGDVVASAQHLSGELFSQATGADGIMIDMEGSGSMSGLPFLGERGASFARQLSTLMPNDQMLNIFAGKPGEVIGLPKKNPHPGCSSSHYPNKYFQKYSWELWSALNRSTVTNCSSDSGQACQMGLFIDSVYDTSIGAYAYPLGSKSYQTFNLGVRDFPFQMKLIANLANQVSNESLIQPICLAATGDTIAAPFGYYQLGFAASGSAGNTSAYNTFNTQYALFGMPNKKHVESGLCSSSMWGQFITSNSKYKAAINCDQDPNAANRKSSVFSAKAPISIEPDFDAITGLQTHPVKPDIPATGRFLGCASSITKVDDRCGMYIQTSVIPESKASSDDCNAPGSINKSGCYSPIDIVNQYLCTQLNALTYVYNDAKLTDSENNMNLCGIGQRDNVSEYLSIGQAFNNVVTIPPTYRQSSYNTMVGPALFQIGNQLGGELSLCMKSCSTSADIPCWESKDCHLIYEFDSVWGNIGNATSGGAAVSTSSWQMFSDWLQKVVAGSGPSAVISPNNSQYINIPQADNSDVEGVVGPRKQAQPKFRLLEGW